MEKQPGPACLGCCRELRMPAWGREVTLTQPGHMLPLKSLLSGFGSVQRNQQEDNRWLAGRLRHTPQRDLRDICQPGFSWPAGVSLCQRLHSVLDFVTSFLRTDNDAALGQAQSEYRNSTACERLYKHEIVPWTQVNVFLSLQNPFFGVIFSKLTHP